MSILVIIHSKTILIKIIQTTFSLFNQFCLIVSKHKSILSKLIMSKSILSKTEPNTHIFRHPVFWTFYFHVFFYHITNTSHQINYFIYFFLFFLQIIYFFFKMLIKWQFIPKGKNFILFF